VSCDLYVTQIFHYIIKKKKNTMEGGLHCCGPGRGSLWKEIHGRPWAQWPETVGLQEEGFFFFFFFSI
jgi:hypothetical protein